MCLSTSNYSVHHNAQQVPWCLKNLNNHWNDLNSHVLYLFWNRGTDRFWSDFYFTVYNWSNLTVTVSFPSKQVRHSIWGTVTRYNWYAILWLLTSLLGGYGIPTERELPRTWSLYSGLHHGYAWWRVYGRGFNIVSFPGNSPVNLLTYQCVSLQTVLTLSLLRFQVINLPLGSPVFDWKLYIFLETR